MTNADEQLNLRYRRGAQLCVDMLANISDPETRIALLEMAQTWMRLAKESETAVPDIVSEPQPETQHQQQIQPKAAEDKE